MRRGAASGDTASQCPGAMKLAASGGKEERGKRGEAAAAAMAAIRSPLTAAAAAAPPSPLPAAGCKAAAAFFPLVVVAVVPPTTRVVQESGAQACRQERVRERRERREAVRERQRWSLVLDDDTRHCDPHTITFLPIARTRQSFSLIYICEPASFCHQQKRKDLVQGKGHLVSESSLPSSASHTPSPAAGSASVARHSGKAAILCHPLPPIDLQVNESPSVFAVSFITFLAHQTNHVPVLLQFQSHLSNRIKTGLQKVQRHGHVRAVLSAGRRR